MVGYISTVFKVIFWSIILMFIMDLSITVIDTITVNSRLDSISVTLKDEVSRNNSVPDTTKPLFKEQLLEVMENSEVATRIYSNIDHPITVDGVSYPPINEDNVVEYGEQITIVTVMEMSPRSHFFTKKSYENGNNAQFVEEDWKFYIKKIETVPALRYLK